VLQSPTEFRELPDDHPYLQGFDALGLMLREGRTLSGHERNCCFLNTGGTRFADVSAVSGLDFADDGRGLALVDWDHDGDIDMWSANRTAPAVRFLRNEMHGYNNYLALRLQGTTCNRDAIGARITVFGESGFRRTKTLYAGNAYLSQSSKWLHFGLGSVERIERLTVRWPGGEQEEIVPPTVNGHFGIVQGSGRAVAHFVSKRSPVKLVPSKQIPLPESDAARIVVAQKISFPDGLNYQTFAGENKPIRDVPDEETLVVLWASWCPNCVEELTAITNSEAKIRDSGVHILALNVDLLHDVDLPDASGAQQFLKELGFPFESGLATPELLAELQNVDSTVLDRHRPLPIPTSVLVDREGHIAVIYKGPIDIEHLAQDVGLRERPPEEFRNATAYVAGIWARPLGPPTKVSFATYVKVVFSGWRNYVLLGLIVVLVGTATVYRSWKKRRAVGRP
jgi:thiol-disulfide isomerase/thioredoxin